MAQDTFEKSQCKLCETLIYQEITKLWSIFCAYDYTFLELTNWYNHFVFVSQGKL